MMYNGILKQGLNNVRERLASEGREVNVEQMHDIVITHAVSAGAAALASGWLPGVGSVVATTICLGFVVGLYIRLGAAMGITLEKGMIRAVASAVIADIAAYLVTMLAAGAVLSFIPIVGNLSASVLTACAQFVLVYMSAVIFVKVLNGLLGRGINPATAGAETLKKEAKAAMASTNMKAAVDEAKSAFNKAKESGDMNKQIVAPIE